MLRSIKVFHFVAVIFVYIFYFGICTEIETNELNPYTNNEDQLIFAHTVK